MTDTAIRRLLTTETEVVVRTRTGAEDDFGTKAWENQPPVTEHWHFQPAQSEEFQGPAVGEVEWVGWGPVDTVADSTAKLTTAAGLELEVVGPVRIWTNPRTALESYVTADFVEAS